MPVEDYSGREKSSLLNIREFWQYLTGGRSAVKECAWAWKHAWGVADC